MKVVSVINYKGGVGKTTLVSNLAAYTASKGKRVLMIDLDPQMSLTFSFMSVDKWKNEYADDRTLKNFFDAIIVSQQPISLKSIIINNILKDKIKLLNWGQLDLISSHLELINIDVTLAAMLGGATPFLYATNFLRCYNHLKIALEKIKNDYDLVIIDCPPNFSAVVKNAVTASDYYLVPAKMDYLSTLGISQLQLNMKKYIEEDYTFQLDNFNKSKPGSAPDYLPVNASMLGIVPTMVEIKNKQPVSALADYIRQLRAQDFYIFQWVRNNSTIFGSSPANGIPVILSYHRFAGLVAFKINIKPELEALGQEFMKLAGI